MSLKSKFKSRVRNLAHQLDKAADLGVQAAYPLVFNMPTPASWRDLAHVGWRFMKATVKETTRVLMLREKEK
jgi:hypothetical protein